MLATAMASEPGSRRRNSQLGCHCRGGQVGRLVPGRPHPVPDPVPLVALVAALQLSGCYLGAQQMLDSRWPSSEAYGVVGAGLTIPVKESFSIWGQVLIAMGGEYPMLEVPTGAAWALGGHAWPNNGNRHTPFWYAGCGVVPTRVSDDQNVGWTVGVFGVVGHSSGSGDKLEFRVKLAPDGGGSLSYLNPSSVSLILVVPLGRPLTWIW